MGSIAILTLVLSPSLLLGYAIDAALLWLAVASGWSPAKPVVLGPRRRTHRRPAITSFVR